eukprot:GILJ01010614.1.p1 GENE.GILJ01010614.1~~GILJ01010614.1.p1  ORF type:complete len:301 (+),score=21.75 GILJ01010614.1:109-903(+)
MDFTIHRLPPSYKVISFALSGVEQRHIKGARKNVQLAKTYFPGWTPRFYVDHTVPIEEIEWLAKRGAEIHWEDGGFHDENIAKFRAFFVADDKRVSRYIVRNSDTRLSARDSAAVQQWEASGSLFHIIRDHPSHSVNLINSGLWGGVYLPYLNVSSLIARFLRLDKSFDEAKFLQTQLYPFMVGDAEHDVNRIYQHDSYSCLEYSAHPFPVARSGYEFVGQVFDESDAPRLSDIEVMQRTPQPVECSTFRRRLFTLGLEKMSLR